MNTVNSHREFLEKLKGKEKAFLLLYKNESEHCQCAIDNLSALELVIADLPVYIADVSLVRDIHPVYQIDSVPSLLVFDNEKYTNVVKGCQTITYYKSLIENAVFVSKAKAEGKEIKRVTVYSTPTCSWCNTLKAWLRKNNIPFTDIDVSRNEQAAQELVRRTGQQGVPQTDINGQIVVGFNQQRLKDLLEIQ